MPDRARRIVRQSKGDIVVTYIITEPCIDVKDRSWVHARPVHCIHEVGRMLVIDPEECIDCGACEPECPVEAIFPEDAVPDKWAPFIGINYTYRRRRSRGRQRHRDAGWQVVLPRRSLDIGTDWVGHPARCIATPVMEVRCVPRMP